MNAVMVENLKIECVHGWGWSQRAFEDSDLVCIESFARVIELGEAVAWVREGRIEFISANLASDRANFGAEVLMRPLADDLPLLSAGKTGPAVLVFGDARLTEGAGQVAESFAGRRRQFCLPETRGFAQEITFGPNA